MKNHVATAQVMHDLRTLGVQLAMDDFGTGSLSFAAVHRFPVQMLKVDECLCSGIEVSKDAAALLHALAVLVKNLGVDLVAEGVESIAQARALQDLGCNFAQGFIFSTPMHAGEFEQNLSRSVAIDHETAGAMSFANRWAERLVL